jgi:hypothetical protein
MCIKGAREQTLVFDLTPLVVLTIPNHETKKTRNTDVLNFYQFDVINFKIYFRYWPDGKKQRYTYYIVEATTEFCCEGYVMR